MVLTSSTLAEGVKVLDDVRPDDADRRLVRHTQVVAG
jgi:hypothetical protein